MQNSAKKNHTWLWFFGVLIVLAIVVVTVLIRYNLGQQLKREELDQARALWKKKGAHSYRLMYTVKRGDGDAETRVVHVRNGVTEFVTIDGRKLADEKKFVYYGMEALFDDIERFLDFDSEEGKPRTFLRAIFDAQDGHVRWFVRRVMGSRERVEISVRELEPFPSATKSIER